MNWDKIFEIKYIKQEEVTNEELQEFLSSWNIELSDEEVVQINSRQKNPFLNGEYPIIASHSGYLSYDDYKFVADYFKELCMATTAIDQLE